MPDEIRTQQKTQEARLIRDEEGLFLTDGTLRMRGDFSHLEKRIRPSVLKSELLVRAAWGRDAGHAPHVLDATAGMGEDAFLLAASGCTVDLYEADPVIAALLQDALLRAAASDTAAVREAACRMVLHAENSIPAMRKLGQIAGTPASKQRIGHEAESCSLAMSGAAEADRSGQPDVILLDPMFPERQKSALVKKKFQLMHQLERPCEDERALFEAALSAGPSKIIVKRPVKGPYLDGRKPAYFISGKTVRYDCYVYAGKEKKTEPHT